MSKDGLRPLPNHVVAPLLRALMTIPRTPDARLILRKADSRRPPSWDATTDYDVLFRDRRVGRIWMFDYTGKSSGDRERYLWHWYWRDIDGRKDTEGHAPTLEAAMADFRRAWDAAGLNVVDFKPGA
jgi:hypothetical protein